MRYRNLVTASIKAVSKRGTKEFHKKKNFPQTRILTRIAMIVQGGKSKATQFHTPLKYFSKDLGNDVKNAAKTI